jgi:hypothetical protein
MSTTAVKGFFQTELRRSQWFWLTGVCLASTILLGLIAIAEHWERAHLVSNAFVLLGLAMTVST